MSKKPPPTDNAQEARELRWALASRYALGSLTREDAQKMICELEAVAGWAAVVTLSEDDTVERLNDAGYDHPKLRAWAADAIGYVAGLDWSNESSSATDMVEERVFDLAKKDGVELKSS
jgi:hypothetical protein